MSVAFLFPGQGSQQVGMGRALASAFAESREVFAEADSALGMPLSRLCFEGPEAELQLTANTQPAILATSIAALRPLVARGVKPDWVAGHSLGEWTALVAAGSLPLADALVAVRRRGQYMQEAVPVGTGAMAAILGLELSAIEAACREAAQGEVVSPANVNSPGQVVIAHGRRGAGVRPGRRRRQAGAFVSPVHCVLDGRPRIAWSRAGGAALDLCPPREQRDAEVVRDGVACRAGLAAGVEAVRWQESVERLVREGVTRFVEIGPGRVLSGLVRKIAKGTQVLNVDGPESLEATVAALRAGAEG
jgi:[acyl-carrier-protein] S-malonyltransferase